MSGDDEGALLYISKHTETRDPFTSFFVNGVEEEGSPALLISVSQLGDIPIKLYFSVGFFVSAMASVLLWALIKFKGRRGRLVTLTAALLTLGAAYQAVLPPFSAPDEITHYNSCYKVSNSILGYEETDEELNKRACDIDEEFSNYYTTGYTYKYIRENMFAPVSASGAEMTRADEAYLGGYSLPRVITAIVISLCRLLNLNGILTAFISRFSALIVFAAAIALSFRIMPEKSSVSVGMITIALLPITIHLGGSFSYDSTLIALAYLIIAYYFRLRDPGEKAARDVAVLGVLCVLIAPLKVVYIVLILLVWLIPKSRLKGKLKHGKLIITILTLRHFAFYNLSVVHSLSAPPAEGPAAAANYSVFYLLGHIGVLTKLVFNTFFGNFTDYVYQLFGGKLGYLALSEVRINPLITASFAVLVIFAFIRCEEDKEDLKIRERLTFAAIFTAALGMLVAACITWTPSGYDYIWGFQSRYLLPVLPLAMVQLNTRYITKKTDGFALVLYSSYILNVFAIINSFVSILSR